MITQSEPFAQALIDIAAADGKEDVFRSQLEEMTEVYQQNPELVLTMKHPRISRDQQFSILKELFGKELDPTMIDFLQVLCAHRMAGTVPEILDSYNKLYDINHNIKTVYVVSAFDMETKQKDALQKMLEKKLNAQIRAEYSVDPSLIGGLRIQTEGLSLDNSFAARLESMKETLQKH